VVDPQQSQAMAVMDTEAAAAVEAAEVATDLTLAQVVAEETDTFAFGFGGNYANCNY
jgi:hypothetical protein